MLEHPLLIAGFCVIVLIMLLLDLGIFNKKGHVITNKEAIVWSVIWISLSMIFSGVIYYAFKDEPGPNGVGNMGLEKFSQFQSAYWIEKSLSVDNLFVFILPGPAYPTGLRADDEFVSFYFTDQCGNRIFVALKPKALFGSQLNNDFNRATGNDTIKVFHLAVLKTYV